MITERPICRAVYGATALSASPSRRCKCISSGRMMVRVCIAYFRVVWFDNVSDGLYSAVTVSINLMFQSSTGLRQNGGPYCRKNDGSNKKQPVPENVGRRCFDGQQGFFRAAGRAPCVGNLTHRQRGFRQIIGTQFSVQTLWRIFCQSQNCLKIRWSSVLAVRTLQLSSVRLK